MLEREQLDLFCPSQVADLANYLFAPPHPKRLKLSPELKIPSVKSSSGATAECGFEPAPELIKTPYQQPSGWVEPYIVRKRYKNYYQEYCYTRYCYRIEGKIKHRHVPRSKEKAIAKLIAERSPIGEVLKMLRSGQ
jgi:hypothetical protein